MMILKKEKQAQEAPGNADRAKSLLAVLVTIYPGNGHLQVKGMKTGKKQRNMA